MVSSFWYPRFPVSSDILNYPGGLPEILGEYTLPDPCFRPGAAPHPASPEPELPLEQAYPAFYPGPEPLEPFEPGLLLMSVPFFPHLPSFRDTDLLDSRVL